MVRATAFIFARGGSKGVPRKNIREIAGKPLIAHAIACARQCQVERVIVSTDDVEIAEIAKAWGAEVPFMRPKELAGDAAPEWLAWRHAVEQTAAIYGAESVERFVSVPATCPLREPKDVKAAMEALEKHVDTDIVITVTASHSNPYFTMVRFDDSGHARLAATLDKPITRRQDAPKIFDIVGVAFVTRPEFIMRANGTFDGRVRAVEVPQERAIDIDTEHDFRVAELLLRERLST